MSGKYTRLGTLTGVTSSAPSTNPTATTSSLALVRHTVGSDKDKGGGAKVKGKRTRGGGKAGNRKKATKATKAKRRRTESSDDDDDYSEDDDDDDGDDDGDGGDGEFVCVW